MTLLTQTRSILGIVLSVLFVLSCGTNPGTGNEGSKTQPASISASNGVVADVNFSSVGTRFKCQCQVVTEDPFNPGTQTSCGTPYLNPFLFGEANPPPNTPTTCLGLQAQMNAPGANQDE